MLDRLKLHLVRKEAEVSELSAVQLTRPMYVFTWRTGGWISVSRHQVAEEAIDADAILVLLEEIWSFIDKSLRRFIYETI